MIISSIISSPEGCCDSSVSRFPLFKLRKCKNPDKQSTEEVLYSSHKAESLQHAGLKWNMSTNYALDFEQVSIVPS